MPMRLPREAMHLHMKRKGVRAHAAVEASPDANNDDDGIW